MAFQGSTPSPEQWAQTTWGPTLAQFMVVTRRRNDAIGMVAAYQANFQDGFAHFAAVRFDPRSRSPLMIFGVAVFLEYVFSCWDFRKLYLEVPEYNYGQLASGHGRLFVIEGRLLLLPVGAIQLRSTDDDASDGFENVSGRTAQRKGIEFVFGPEGRPAHVPDGASGRGIATMTARVTVGQSIEGRIRSVWRFEREGDHYARCDSVV
jgi:hypothetical protein